MIEFRRTAGSLASSLFAALGGGLLALFLWAMLLELNAAGYLVAAAATVAVAWYLIRSEDDRFVLDGEELSCYRRGKLSHRFALGEYAVVSRANTPGLFTPFRAQLFVSDAEGVQRASIDCTALGARQCEELFGLVRQRALDYREEPDPRARRKRRDRDRF